ncbi:unnamed protein product [Acanthoscelides obtectus]|uniref:Uncharacterized protein n=1 Tax=Acanthoscelides obtectus TaxID=200917 RepID=A0A9P0PDU8_ACAOB|nr:unnamed protein product [Acanthoscelides obtectus]CAK1641197.1 hypothetical protein AOBTE_LOCUS12230 [Acanthoscelides obtectus]
MNRTQKHNLANNVDNKLQSSCSIDEGSLVRMHRSTQDAVHYALNSGQHPQHCRYPGTFSVFGVF